MRVIAHVLRKIDDDKQLVDQITRSPAIAELVHSYNNIAMVARSAEDEGLALVTGDTFGQDFKRHLGYLPTIDLHRLLDRYLSHFVHYDRGNATREQVAGGHGHREEDEAEDEGEEHDSASERENRRLMHWGVKALVICCITIVMVVVGAMVAILTHNHTADNAVFKSIMVTAGEIIKIIITSK